MVNHPIYSNIILYTMGNMYIFKFQPYSSNSILPGPNNFHISSSPSGMTKNFAAVKKSNIKALSKSPIKKFSASPMKKFSGSPLKKLAASPGKSPGKGLTPADNAFSNRVYQLWKEKFATEDGKGCQICPGKIFSAESSLKRHYKQVHELVCGQCKMEFPEEHLLKEHHREQHEFWCFPCNKVFTAFSSLKRHNVQAHDGIPQGKDTSSATDIGIKMEVSLKYLYVLFIHLIMYITRIFCGLLNLKIKLVSTWCIPFS